MKTIIKYGNRKFYDKNTSNYVTFSQLTKLIKDQVDFRVVTHKTKVDITSETLAAIVWNNERDSKTPISIDLLRKIITYQNQLEVLK